MSDYTPDPSGSNLTRHEKELRQKFVEEYLTDYDAVKAARRVGFTGNFAIEYAQRFMDEPYVLNLIKQKQSVPLDTDASITDEASTQRQRIIQGLLREANFFGPGSSQAARVAALSKLASLYGMEASKKDAGDDAVKGGVMTVPPEPSLDEWERRAMRNQEELVRDSGTPVH